MIQAAHVGVGISGQEGMQAVMASDFAIAQFWFLTDLLLVHGRWSYHRICKVVTYFFYKNLTFTLTQFWFTFETGFSGQRFYDDWFQSLFNVIFTALPVIIIGLFDKDVSATLSKQYPELYKEGIRNSFFKWRVVATWAFFAIYQSLVLYYFVVASSSRAINSAGKMFGLWDVSTMAFTSIVVTVNLRLLMMCNTITRWHHISVGGSILAYFLFIFIYSGIVLHKDQITERDEEALKYLKDIKWCKIDIPKGFKLEFVFDTNPFFKNSVLTNTYHMVNEDNESICSLKL